MKSLKIFLLFILFTAFMTGQTASIFSNTAKGLGLSNHFLSTAAMGMGNAGLANSDSVNLNYYNYSQWSNIKYTYFDMNFVGESNSFETRTFSSDKGIATVGGIALAFPIIEGKLSSFFTVIPLYGMYHKSYQIYEEGTEFEHSNYYSKTGRIIQYDWGLSYKVNSVWSVAATMIFASGNYRDEYILVFDDPQFADQSFVDNYEIKSYGFGLSTTLNWQGKYFLAFYGEAFPDCKFSIKYSEYGFGGGEKETIHTSLPYNIGVGVAVKPDKKIALAADLIFKNWEAGVPTYIDDSGYYENIYQFNAGIEFRPQTKWNAPLYKKISKRAGISTGNEGYMFKGNSINYFAVTGGVGIPLNNFGGKLNLALMIGKRGDMIKNGAEENFVKFGLSIKVGEKWFVRVKN